MRPASRISPSAMQGLGSGPITLFGTHEQKRRWLPDVRDRTGGRGLRPVGAGGGFGCRGAGLRGRTRWARSRSPQGREDLDLQRRDRGPLRGVLPNRRGSRRQGPVGFSSSRRACRVSRSSNGSTRSRHIPWPVSASTIAASPFRSASALRGEGFKIAMATLDVFRSTVGAAALGLGQAGSRRDARPR